MSEEPTNPQEDGGSPPAPPVTESPERLRSRIRWGLVALALLAAAIVFLAYQNIEDVPVRAFWWEFSIPLLVVIVATAVLTLVIQRLVAWVFWWRRRRTRPYDGPLPRRRIGRRWR